MKKLKESLILQLIIAVTIGIIIGLISNESVIRVIGSIKYILGQIIFFVVPLIIIGFIAPSITRLQSDASKLLAISVAMAYVSSVGAALFSATAGYLVIPSLNIATDVYGLKDLPELLLKLDIPQIMPVMSALVLSVLLGISAVSTKSKKFIDILEEFQLMVLFVIDKVIIPILPIFIASTFAQLAYEGSITKQAPVFLVAIILIIIGHYIWLAFLYFLASVKSKKNAFSTVKLYAPAYVTALGTMSSAATLSVALKCAKKSPLIRKDIVDFSIPLFANIHLCGSVLTETFFIMIVSLVLYGSLPSFGSMMLFIILFGVFAIGAPGVPGGTVMASIGLVVSIFGFDATGTALLLTIFALQDSFGTACNVTGDGALSIILSSFADDNDTKAKKQNRR